MEELPIGWEYATIPELVARDGIYTDGDWVESKDQDPNGAVRLIQLADVGDGKFIDKSSRFLTATKAEELNCTFLVKDDVLVARMPDPLGRACLFPMNEPEAFVTVVDVCAIRLRPDIVDPRFLMFLINSPESRNCIEEYKSGSTRKRISRGNLSKISFPIPPANEQKRIVAKIEELFSELDKGIESLNTALEQLEVYRQAVLKHAFEGRLTEGWRGENKDKLETADELIERINRGRESEEKTDKNGKKPANTKKPIAYGHPDIPEDLSQHCTDHWTWLKLCDVSEVSGGLTKNPTRNSLSKKMKYLRVANVYADKLLLDDVTEIGVTEEEFNKLQLVAGDLLVVEGNGSIDQIGRLAEWTGEIDQIGHQNHLIRIRMINGMAARFFLLFLLSPLGRKFIIQQASSTTGLHTLSISKVSGLPVPVPTLEEQEVVLSEVDDILSKINKMENEISNEAERSESLRQSILKRAFSGNLVEQDPNDEPASALLERIKATKVGPKTKTKVAR